MSRSTYEKWLKQCPEEAAALRDCGALYINRKAVRGWGETTAGYELILTEGIEGVKKRIEEARKTLDIVKPGDYAKMSYLRALDMAADGIVTMSNYAQELLDCLWVKFSEPCLFQDAVTAQYSAGYPMFENMCVGGIDAIGVADLINSVYAVKHLVFDEKKLSMQRLCDALAADFQGCEDVKLLCDRCEKYGNDCKEVDDLASELFAFIADEIDSYDSELGKMTSGILPVSGNTPFGMEVGALPSGRRAFLPLADGVSPNQGTDLEGMGAVAKSVSCIPHGRFTQGTLLNQRLDPSFVERPDSTQSLMAFLKSMCTLGVFHTQFNTVSTQTLLDAQEVPEEYKGLMVRVAGYTAFFTELGKETQNDIISRTAQVS